MKLNSFNHRYFNTYLLYWLVLITKYIWYEKQDPIKVKLSSFIYSIVIIFSDPDGHLRKHPHQVVHGEGAGRNGYQQDHRGLMDQLVKINN